MSITKNNSAHFLTVKEQKDFTEMLVNTDIVKEPYKTIFLLQMYTQLRIGDILKLQKNNIDLENNTINISSYKYNKDLTIPIPFFLREYLANHINFSEKNGINLLFSHSNKPISFQSVCLILRKIFKNNFGKEKVYVYTLRNTYINRFMNSIKKENSNQQALDSEYPDEFAEIFKNPNKATLENVLYQFNKYIQKKDELERDIF